MKNTTKAAVAGGVGVALLLGGAGTLAFWTDTEEGPEATVQAGTLELGALTGAGWELRHVGNGGTATEWKTFNPGDQIVPGDELQMTQNVPVTLAGEAIAAQFTGDISVSSSDPAGAALATALGDPELSATSLSGTSEDFTFDPGTGIVRGEGTGDVAVTTKLSFPWGAADDYNPTKLGTLDFTVDYTLTQVPGNPAA